MALAINDDHRALAEVVKSFAAAEKVRASSRSALQQPTAALPGCWKHLSDLGWLGLHVPEAHGGSGYGLPELAVVADELGWSVSPGPFLASAAAAAILAQCGTDAQRERYLREVVDGSLIVGLALTPGLTAQSGAGADGDAGAVLAGRWAKLLMVRIDDDIVLVDSDHAGVHLEQVNGLDPSLGLSRLTVRGLVPPEGATLTAAAPTALRILRTLAAAEAAGGARACLDMAVDYAKVREQFGRTIGTFQAVKHHLANMLVRTELATAVSWDAARAATGTPQGALAADAAAALALRAYQENAQQNIQILGGIGFTWEHDAHLYLRRAVALRNLVHALGSAEDDLYELSRAGVRRQYDVDLPEEAARYRSETREFLARYHAAPPTAHRRLLAESGYLVPHWPRPYGRAAGPVEQLVIEDEFSGVEVPVLGIGGWVLLTLLQTAAPEQVERWIPPSLAGQLTWCQLFSEPDAGSDAASVQTKGIRVEGGWRVTGQKVWTSGAQHSDRGLATVRTEPSAPKHKGITAMVVDLRAPGVEVRPLREITGEALFNEVFLNDVFVPDADVVGEVNEGWKVARTTLGNERVTIGGGSREGVPASALIDLAERHAQDTGQELRRRIAGLIAEEHAMRLVNLRQAARAVTGSGPGPEGNVTKLLSAEHAQRVTELAVEIAGPAALIGQEERVTFEYLFDRCLSIAGGTSEITRNVIAERILGLPRDPLIR
ncbi:acyl-CoA dehydrogenase [Peterkaempfera bronchialis]|uniref:Acyl-CoA dehydrogenase n=1 Tax=Peterkaempfera bronchialis TaxID=2126346 RepID=A0A345SRF4_9ACTN|nr:acyl-CoA dehydrogenase [Peterkaempfera bronchialis]AXI76309.1 acyl-CoA dehydrogenase [Peterkaempfera bronchialis]